MYNINCSIKLFYGVPLEDSISEAKNIIFLPILCVEISKTNTKLSNIFNGIYRRCNYDIKQQVSIVPNIRKNDIKTRG